MTPSLCAKLAQRVFPVRWWLLAASVGSVLLIAATVAFAGQKGLAVVAPLLGPMVGLPWAALCAAVWFHPERGNMQPASKLVGTLPPFIQTGIRWYAAVFLAFFVVVCGLVWPLSVLSVI